MMGPILNVLESNILGGLSRPRSEDPLVNRPPAAAPSGWQSTAVRRGPDPDSSMGTRRAGEGGRRG